MRSMSPSRRGRRASAQLGTDESEIILALVASGLMRLTSWTGPQDSRQPYPSALQYGLDRLTWWCMQQGLEPALLHCGEPVHAEAATRLRAQIAKANSSNATANRRFAGSSTASS